MIRNDTEGFAQRLYQRVPAHYRVYDEEQGYPLLALLRVVGEQAANIRQDLDLLWDNFFIETCDDWVVPYLAALVGTNLLTHPVGQSNRLDVRNTVMWRRSKGTPAMLRALAEAISGWPTTFAEFFKTLGWSQNLNHLRLDRPLTPDLRDPYPLSLLGHADDPLAHAADFKPGYALDQPRILSGQPGVGDAAWGTPGRYQIKNLGFFVHRLQTFPVYGSTPAAVAPGLPVPNDAACFTFDPLFREIPLFVEKNGMPISRAAFDETPWQTFGTDVAVRQFGILLASGAEPTPDMQSSRTAFDFGGAGAGLTLDATHGIRLLEPHSFELGGVHFIITAGWRDGGTTTPLGALSTLHAALSDAAAFKSGSAAPGAGHLVISLQTGRATADWPDLPDSPAARFPGAVIAVRAARPGGPVHAADALYVYLPAGYIAPADTPVYDVADDGSTYTDPSLDITSLARASEGQVYPPRLPTTSTDPAYAFTQIVRQSGGAHVADTGRFGPSAVVLEIGVFTGAFQQLGTLASIAQGPTPAFTYVPSTAALNGQVPGDGLLTINLRPLQPNTFMPATELIIASRSGPSLLIYLPEIASLPDEGKLLFVADDGCTYDAPPDDVGRRDAQDRRSYSGLTLARASLGQVLPIAGLWPVQQRRPVALDLCRCERNTLLRPGELGIDPELGRFALAPGDPGIGLGGLSVDYVEAFSERVGARNFDRQLDPAIKPTRLVALAGDALSASHPSIALDHIHPSLTAALAAASDGDVIELTDSATYSMNAPVVFNAPAVKKLTVRAAENQRPCLSFYKADGSVGSFRITTSLDSLELNGLLISGAPFQIEAQIKALQLTACTLDPGGGGLLTASDDDITHRADFLLCRCITGGLRTGKGISQITVADSIVDQAGDLAIGGATKDSAAQGVHLERVTVLGTVRCDVLNASECLLNDKVTVDDQQAGCIRFSRYEKGSVLPRRYQCVPSDEQVCPPGARCLAPLFNARRFGRPDYMQLTTGCPPEILTASEAGAEVGAFATALNTIRLNNLEIKLREFLPVGLSALVIAET